MCGVEWMLLLLGKSGVRRWWWWTRKRKGKAKGKGI